MRHPAPDAFARFADGLASPLEARSVSEHLAVCARCDELLRNLRDLEALLREDPAEAPAGYFETLPERVERRLGSSGVDPRGSGWVWRRPSAAVFGSLLAAAATAAFLAILSPWTLRRATRTEPLSSAAEGVTRPNGGVAPLPADEAGPGARPAALPKLKGKVGASGFGADEREAGSPSPQDAQLGPAPQPGDGEQPLRAEESTPHAGAPSESAAARPERMAAPGDGEGLVTSLAEPAAIPPSEVVGASHPRVQGAEQWRARARELERRAESSRDARLADDARLGACEAWLEAFEVGGVVADRRAAMRGAEAYLARADARQRDRALRLRARLSPSGGRQ